MDSLFLPQHGRGSLTMDYLLLENLDYAYFHSCWISSPLLPQGKELGFNLQPLRSTAREQHLPFKVFLGKTFFFFFGGLRGKIFLLLSRLSVPPSLDLV